MKEYGITLESDLDLLKADPYVIAHAHSKSGIVVTGEKPASAMKLGNRKIPSICQSLEIGCMKITRFIWELRNNPPS